MNSVLLPAYYYGKKKSKRVGRPPGGHSNLEGGVKRRGRRRKRRKQLFVHKKRRSSASVDNTPAGSPQVTQTLLSNMLNAGLLALLLNCHCYTGAHASCESACCRAGKWRRRRFGWRWFLEWRLGFWAPGRSPGWFWTISWEVAAHDTISIPTSNTQAHATTPEALLTLVLWWREPPAFTQGFTLAV